MSPGTDLLLSGMRSAGAVTEQATRLHNLARSRMGI